MLIRNAEIYQVGMRDLRFEDGTVTEIGNLAPLAYETTVDACGGALLPGLNDHHLHFLSYAASLDSIDCSPRNVGNESDFAQLLRSQEESNNWLRGVGYHESVAGDIDCHWLDQHCPQRPLRIQHRTGRLWIFNSSGIRLLQKALQQQLAPTLLSKESLNSGRFYDSDETLAPLIGKNLPPVREASKRLSSYGVTGFSDLTPTNDAESFELFERCKSDNRIVQQIQLARRAPFTPLSSKQIIPGPIKIHLHESRLPPLDDLVERISQSHLAGIPVAIHCVTEIELLFSLAALEEAGSISGDRLEHASITPDYSLQRIKDLGLTIVSQPFFIEQKGDSYIRNVEPEAHDLLYRCQSFLERGIPFAGSSDAPFGGADPWATMRSAIFRKTASGNFLGKEEALTPERALAIFLGSLEKPADIHSIGVGAPADFCLLLHPWSVCRERLIKEDIKMVFAKGNLVYQKPQEDVAVDYTSIASISPQSSAV